MDSGLLYRFTAFLVQELAIGIDDEQGIENLLTCRVKISYSNAGVIAWQRDRLSESLVKNDEEFTLSDSQRQSYVRWNGDDITEEVRSDPISHIAARVAASARVRSVLIRIQQRCRRAPGLVADGRDMGTVIFPDAELKVFLKATLEMRARRRLQQLGLADSKYQEIRDMILERDQKDSLRKVAPAVPAKDSVRLDNSHLSIEETVDQVLKLAVERRLVRTSST